MTEGTADREAEPSLYELWRQAGGDRERYRQLMREHGYLISGTPTPLPCGWPPAEAREAPAPETGSPNAD